MHIAGPLDGLNGTCNLKYENKEFFLSISNFPVGESRNFLSLHKKSLRVNNERWIVSQSNKVRKSGAHVVIDKAKHARSLRTHEVNVDAFVLTKL